ncbi:MAG: HAD family hydrolase, partial [Pseudomonadota bacterium]
MDPWAVIFDFDGTLIESNGVKDAAFRQIFADSPHLETIMAYHQAHNHVVRYDNFRHIVEEIVGETYDAARAASLSAAFGAAVFTGLTTCPMVRGTDAMLAALRAQGAGLHLVSFSPDHELHAVLAARGWDDVFDSVSGASRPKHAHIAAILERFGVGAANAIYVGDTEEDQAAAA